MDIIREHLMYKNSPLLICMKNLNPQEHYECIRIFLESSKDNVTICCHGSTNQFINILIKKLKILEVDCSLKKEDSRHF
jgi:hypothetical protein